MKIIDMEIIPVRHYLFVKVYTDAGIVGLGEAGNWGFLESTKSCLEKFREFIIGKDPFTIEHHSQNMYRAMYFRGSVIVSAMSAIDIALWDIKGKALGVPVYELLGGKTRDRVRTYAPLENGTPDQIADSVGKLKALGFSAGKIFVSDYRKSDDPDDKYFYSNRIAYSVSKVKAAREAAGDNFDLIMEAHRGFNVPEAIAFGRETEQYRPMVYEDPITPDNPDAMALVATKVNVPIATGERFYNLKEFETVLSRNACQYVRPDICAVGGISVTKKVAALAEAHDALVIPHNPLGPVSTAACLQICACIPNVGIMELPGFCMNGREDAMVVNPLKVEKGCLIVSDGPGIGVELSEDAAKLYPPKDRATAGAMINFDGSVMDF